MSIKVSKTFLREIHDAAAHLNSENPKVYLEIPFSGFYVCFEKPEKQSSEWFSFIDTGIDQEGGFYLVCEDMMGKKLVP